MLTPSARGARGGTEMGSPAGIPPSGIPRSFFVAASGRLGVKKGARGALGGTTTAILAIIFSAFQHRQEPEAIKAPAPGYNGKHPSNRARVDLVLARLPET
jgi:hypothetical protein